MNHTDDRPEPQEQAMQALTISLITLAPLLVVGLNLVSAGAFNVAADDPHLGGTHPLMEAARERSI